MLVRTDYCAYLTLQSADDIRRVRYALFLGKNGVVPIVNMENIMNSSAFHFWGRGFGSRRAAMHSISMRIDSITSPMTIRSKVIFYNKKIGNNSYIQLFDGRLFTMRWPSNIAHEKARNLSSDINIGVSLLVSSSFESL